MENGKAERIREIERMTLPQRPVSTPCEIGVPLLVRAGSSDLANWRQLVEALGKVSSGGHAVNDGRAERRG